MTTRMVMISLAVLAVTPVMVRGAVTTNIHAKMSINGEVMGGVGMYDEGTHVLSYPAGFRMYDRKGVIVFDGKAPEGISTQSYLKAFDGTRAVFSDDSVETTWMYGLDKNGFALLGNVTGDLALAFLQPSELVLFFNRSSKAMPPKLYTVKGFDLKMKRMKWQINTPLCRYDWLNSKTFALRTDTNVLCVTKGRVIANVLLPTEDCTVSYGMDGSLAYWTLPGGGTNGPLTYLDKKGKVIVSGVTFAEAGNEWSQHRILNKGYCYVDVGITSTQDVIHAYKLGKKVTYSTHVPFDDFYTMGLDGTTVYIITRDPTTRSKVTVFDKTLTKVLWQSDIWMGSIQSLGNGMFCGITKDSDSTTLRGFNKKGEINRITFNMP